MDEFELFRHSQEQHRKLLEQILRELAEKNCPALEITNGWLDDFKLGRLLNISPSTIKRRREDGTFKFFKVGARYHYLLEDILKLKDRFKK